MIEISWISKPAGHLWILLYQEPVLYFLLVRRLSGESHGDDERHTIHRSIVPSPSVTPTVFATQPPRVIVISSSSTPDRSTFGRSCVLVQVDNTFISHHISPHKRTYKSSLLDIMGIVTSTLRSVNAWAHLPSTLRAGYVLGWGALFGANVSFRVLES